MAIRLRSMGPRLRIRGGTFTPIHFRKSPAAMPAVGYGSGGNRFILFFFAGLLAGTAAANFLHASLSDQAGYYLNLLSHQSNLGRTEQLALFGDICRQRMIEVLIAWLIGLTAYAVPCFCVLSAGFGLSVGVVLSVMTGQKGILGLPFFLASVMPQAFLYVPVWCLLLMWGIRRNGRLRIPALLLVLAFVAAGSACEVWLNPYFLSMTG